MQFGETRGMALLTILIALGILIVDRLTAPTTLMDRAIDNAEKVARDARSSAEHESFHQAMRSMGAVASPVASSAQGGQIAASLGAAGRSCPVVLRVLPISGGNGIYRITCADRAGGAEHSYRLDTRKGDAVPDDGHTA